MTNLFCIKYAYFNYNYFTYKVSNNDKFNILIAKKNKCYSQFSSSVLLPKCILAWQIEPACSMSAGDGLDWSAPGILDGDPASASALCTLITLTPDRSLSLSHSFWPSVPLWSPLSCAHFTFISHIVYMCAWGFFPDFIPRFYLRALPLPLETLLCSVLCHERVMKKHISRKAFSVHVRTR